METLIHVLIQEAEPDRASEAGVSCSLCHLCLTLQSLSFLLIWQAACSSSFHLQLSALRRRLCMRSTRLTQFVRSNPWLKLISAALCISSWLSWCNLVRARTKQGKMLSRRRRSEWSIHSECPARGVSQGPVLMSWLCLISMGLQSRLVMCMEYPLNRKFDFKL